MAKNVFKNPETFYKWSKEHKVDSLLNARALIKKLRTKLGVNLNWALIQDTTNKWALIKKKLSSDEGVNFYKLFQTGR